MREKGGYRANRYRCRHWYARMPKSVDTNPSLAHTGFPSEEPLAADHAFARLARIHTGVNMDGGLELCDNAAVATQ